MSPKLNETRAVFCNVWGWFAHVGDGDKACRPRLQDRCFGGWRGWEERWVSRGGLEEDNKSRSGRLKLLSVRADPPTRMWSCWVVVGLCFLHRHLGLAYGRREPAFNAINNVALILWRNHVARYNNTSWIPGFARDPLSRSLSPSLSRPSLPSLLSVPAFYPPSLGLPGFAQDNCIPEILFKPWCLVTLKFSPLTPPPSDGVGWGLHVLVIFSAEFFLSIFSAVREISRTFEMLTPQPPPGRWTPRGGVGKHLFYWFSGHSWVSLTLVDWRQRKRRHYVDGLIVTSFATQRLAEEAGS